MTIAAYRIVSVGKGLCSVHDAAYGQTCHPGVGPAAEAESLYVRQTRLHERLASASDPFVAWDVGLGSAANAVALLHAARLSPREIHLVSFDRTLDPLRFALSHTKSLPHLVGWEEPLGELVEAGVATFSNDQCRVRWQFQGGDFPGRVRSALEALPHRALPPPDLILYDPFSPAANAEMWTLPLFTGLRQLVLPPRPCLLPTYSRSTLVRVTLLLAGFWVGAGHPTGAKEETTLAATDPSLIERPLDRRWLDRALRSHSAEPLMAPPYRQRPLSEESRSLLLAHPQFG